MTLQVQVNQEVAIDQSRSNRSISYGWKVTKVTPKGQIVVQRTRENDSAVEEKRFNPDGTKLIGAQILDARGQVVDSGFYSGDRYRLITDVQAEKDFDALRSRARAAATAITQIKPTDFHHRAYHWPTDVKQSMLQNIQEMQKALDEAKAAVEAI